MKFSKCFFLALILIVAVAIICPAQTLLKRFKPGTTYRYEGTMQVKAHWMVDTGKVPQTLNSEVTIYPSRQMGKEAVLPVKQTLFGHITFQFLAEDKEGIYVYAIQGPTDPEPQISPGKHYKLKYPMEIGTAWNYQTDKGEAFNCRITAKELVTVVAGNFECLKIEQTGKADFQGQMANFKGYEWLDLNGQTIKSYVEFQINDPVMGQPATFQISLQLASIVKQ